MRIRGRFGGVSPDVKLHRSARFAKRACVAVQSVKLPGRLLYTYGS